MSISGTPDLAQQWGWDGSVVAASVLRREPCWHSRASTSSVAVLGPFEGQHICFRTELMLAQLCQHAGCFRVGEVLETAGCPKYCAARSGSRADG